MKNDITILWADDEIEMLKPQILFLEEKGFNVMPVSNGLDAIDKCLDPDINLIFLDEMMPGLSGLDLQRELIECNIHVPTIFITGMGTSQ